MNVPRMSNLELKKSLTVAEACMAIFWPTPGFEGKSFEIWVLNRWSVTVLNFCVCSTSQQGILMFCQTDTGCPGQKWQNTKNRKEKRELERQKIDNDMEKDSKENPTLSTSFGCFILVSESLRRKR